MRGSADQLIDFWRGRSPALDEAQTRELANRVNEHPWLADLVIWRARRSPRILRRMSAVLEEQGNPGNLVSLRGIVRLFVPIP